MVVVHRSDELTDGLPTSAGACGSVYTVIVKLVRQTFHIFTHFHTRIVIGTQFPAIILLTASIGAVFHRTYPGSPETGFQDCYWNPVSGDHTPYGLHWSRFSPDISRIASAALFDRHRHGPRVRFRSPRAIGVQNDEVA